MQPRHPRTWVLAGAVGVAPSPREGERGLRVRRRSDAIVGEVVSEHRRPRLLVALRPVVLLKQQHVLIVPPLLVRPLWGRHEGLLILIRCLRLQILLRLEIRKPALREVAKAREWQWRRKRRQRGRHWLKEQRRRWRRKREQLRRRQHDESELSEGQRERAGLGRRGWKLDQGLNNREKLKKNRND